jgi:hypothetical protein
MAGQGIRGGDFQTNWPALVAEKELDLAVRVSSMPLQRRKIQTSLPVGTPRSFTLLSVPFYLVSEIPRLVGAIRKG